MMKGRSKAASVLACLALALLCVFPTACGGPETEKRLGLYNENGVMMKDGKPFYGLGVNYYSMFNYVFKYKWSTEVPLKGLETLAQNGVKVIRFSCEPDLGKYDFYFQREEKYFETLDLLVERAEELGVGLIVEFFGNLAGISEYFGEDVNAAVHDENSKSSQYRQSYVEKVVRRYAQSPAVYGWEFGNEVAWNALPTEFGRPIGYAETKLLYARFAETVRANDPHRRIIGSGDQSLRDSAWHIAYEDKMETDTLSQHRQMLAELNPGDMDAVCMHRYADGVNVESTPDLLCAEGYSPRSAPIVVKDDETGADHMLYEDWKGYMNYMLTESKALGKTCYIGEAGWTYTDAEARVGYDQIKTVASAICSAAFETKYPLILFWNYDPLTTQVKDEFGDKGSGTEYSWNENWEKGRAYLDVIKTFNQKFDEYIETL